MVSAGTCCVTNCGKGVQKGMKHNLPTDDKRCKLWLAALGMSDRWPLLQFNKRRRKSYNVCDNHFSEKQHKIFLPGNSTNLKYSAVPDINLTMPPRDIHGARQTWERLPDGNKVWESLEIESKKSSLETLPKSQSTLSSELINVLQTQVNLPPLEMSIVPEIRSNSPVQRLTVPKRLPEHVPVQNNCIETLEYDSIAPLTIVFSGEERNDVKRLKMTKIKDQSNAHYTIGGTAVDNEENSTFITEENDSGPNSVVVNENNSTHANVHTDMISLENSLESTQNVNISANGLGQCAVCFEVIEEYDKEMKSMSDVEMRQIVEKNLGFTFTDCEMYPKFFCPLCVKVIKGFEEFRKDCQKKHRDYARYLETFDKIKMEQRESSNDMVPVETKLMVETDDNLSDFSLEDTAEEPVVKVKLETVKSEKRFRVCHLCGKDFNKTCRYCTASDLNQRQIEPSITYKYSHVTHCDLLFANLHNVSSGNKLEFYCKIVESYFDGDAYLCPVCGASIPLVNHSANAKQKYFIDHLWLHKNTLKCALHDHPRKSKKRKICPSQENQDKLPVHSLKNSCNQLKS